MKSFCLCALALSAFIVMTVKASACSCAGDFTARSILARSAAVFTGVVHKVRPLSSGRSVTTFGIIEAFKGPSAGASVRVIHPSRSSASCGVRFQPGRTYTLSVHQRPGMADYSTSHCSTWMFSARARHKTRLISGLRALGRR